MIFETYSRKRGLRFHTISITSKNIFTILIMMFETYSRKHRSNQLVINTTSLRIHTIGITSRNIFIILIVLIMIFETYSRKRGSNQCIMNTTRLSFHTTSITSRNIFFVIIMVFETYSRKRPQTLNRIWWQPGRSSHPPKIVIMQVMIFPRLSDKIYNPFRFKVLQVFCESEKCFRILMLSFCDYDTLSDHLESLSTSVPEILTAGRLNGQCSGLYG